MQPQIAKIELHGLQVMAILNVTPDSFYAKSRTFTDSEIENRVKQIIDEGATIIDIGGYSSRPGADEVSIEEEWKRVERGVRAVRKIAPQITISVDTFRAEVAERIITSFGAIVINDISAGELDSKLPLIAAKYQVPYIAMHMRGTPQTMQQHTSYRSITEDLKIYFKEKISYLRKIGIEDIIIDLGFGFAKTIEQNYELMNSIHEFMDLETPILVGISRKSMIYKPLNIEACDALNGTIALNWEALRQGASIIRVHDVKAAVESVKLFKLLKDNDKSN